MLTHVCKMHIINMGDDSLEFEIIEYIEIDDNIKETLLERE